MPKSDEKMLYILVQSLVESGFFIEYGSVFSRPYPVKMGPDLQNFLKLLI